MKTTLRILSAAATIVTALGMTACNTNKPADVRTGEIETVSATATATVQSIDYNTRMVTLRWDDGQVITYKAGPEVRRFNEVRVGDTVKASVAESVAVWVGPSSEAPAVTQKSMMVRGEPGQPPKAVITEVTAISARVLKVDSVARTITIQGPMGNTRVIKVASDVNLANVTVGNDITLELTQAVALWVDKP